MRRFDVDGGEIFIDVGIFYVDSFLSDCQAHADYCASLKSLYDEYKDRYNDGKPLVFIGKDFHDSDIIPTVFRRLGVHTSHVIPGTVQHRIELKQFAEEKRKEKVQRLQALEDERNEMINGEL